MKTFGRAALATDKMVLPSGNLLWAINLVWSIAILVLLASGLSATPATGHSAPADGGSSPS
jgi:hypothetical protein